MGTPDKHTSKIAAALCMAVLFLPAYLTSADTLPTEEIVNNLAEDAKKASDTFMRQSFKLRMQYEYSGKFLTSNHKETLRNLAGNASEKLQKIIEKQETLERQIEDYRGDDWDKKYGSTGLWRKLSADIYTSKLNKFQIDYYLALTSERQQQEKTLHLILDQIDTLVQNKRQLGPNLTKGKALALLAQTEPSCKNAAVEEFEKFKDYSDIYLSTTALIEKMKLLRRVDTNLLNILAGRLGSNRNNRYLELVLSLMFLQRQYDPEAFEKTLSLWPETEDLIAFLAVSDLSYQLQQQQNLQQISIYEAELAALAAWKDEASKHEKLLRYLSNTEKFQTPLILYVTAAKQADSSPAEAVNLLVKASKLQQKNDRLNIESWKIAEQAAQLAYNLFIADSLNCQTAIEAFHNYYTTAGEKINEELEYLYAIILKKCSRNTKNKEVLEKIAGRPAGKFRNKAQLDLIIQMIRNAHKPHSELLNQLKNVMADCAEANEQQLLIEAMDIYCQVFLESDNNAGARKVLDIITKNETPDTIYLDVVKSKLLWKLSRFEESVECSLKTIDSNNHKYVHDAMELISDVVEYIDQLPRQTNDFSKFIGSCLKIAQYCERTAFTTYGLVPGNQARLYLAEILIFATSKDQEKLLAAEKLLNKIPDGEKKSSMGYADCLRCRARLLNKHGKYKESAELWAKLCRIRKSEATPPNQRSWKWWRAKYYELYCWSKCPQTNKQEVLHTIEVLENSFTDIPPFWAEKLNYLKHLCRSNLVKANSLPE